MSYCLGVDVGRTYADLLLLDPQNGAFSRHNTPPTPHDSSGGDVSVFDFGPGIETLRKNGMAETNLRAFEAPEWHHELAEAEE